MHTGEVLSAFDSQLRQRPMVETGSLVEREDPVVRVVAGAGDWTGVTWSALTPADADLVVAREIRRFAQLSSAWEWKLYSYDEPADLGQRLLDAGLSAGPTEAVLVGDLATLDLRTVVPDGVVIRPVVDDHDLEGLTGLHDEVFGGDHSAVVRTLATAIRAEPPTAAAWVAWTSGVAVSAGRLEFHPGTEFASLWGGGTLPAWRSRGIFRALVAARADLARSRGFRYLQVDATDDSAPILRRLGFVQLCTTTPYTYVTNVGSKGGSG